MQQSIPCPRCGSPNAFGQRFCWNCATALASSCPNCGLPWIPVPDFVVTVAHSCHRHSLWVGTRRASAAGWGQAPPPQQAGWGQARRATAGWLGTSAAATAGWLGTSAAATASWLGTSAATTANRLGTTATTASRLGQPPPPPPPQAGRLGATSTTTATAAARWLGAAHWTAEIGRWFMDSAFCPPGISCCFWLLCFYKR